MMPSAIRMFADSCHPGRASSASMHSSAAVGSLRRAGLADHHRDRSGGRGTLGVRGRRLGTGHRSAAQGAGALMEDWLPERVKTVVRALIEGAGTTASSWREQILKHTANDG